MTALTGRSAGTSYTELLKISEVGLGLNGPLRAITDGAGNESPLKLSTSQFSLYDLIWPETGATEGLMLRVGANSQLIWSVISTGDIDEGGGNEYFTVERARESISASGSLAYNTSTGVISYTETVNSVAGKIGNVLLVKADVGLDLVDNKSSQTIRGELTNTDVVTGLGYVPVDVMGDTLQGSLDMANFAITNVPAPVNGQDVVNKDYVDTLTTNDSTIVRTTGAQTINGDKTFGGNTIIDGNLTVTGDTITVNSQTVLINDNIIELNSNFTSGIPSADAGFQVNRGDYGLVQFLWDETNDRFTMQNDLNGTITPMSMYTGANIAAGSFTGPLTGNAASATKLQTARTINGVSFDGTANISFTTSAIAEGSNQYYTNAKASAAAPVQSVAGRTGNVVLGANDVSGVPAINPTTPKDGDIRVVGAVISIYGALAWHQVFPAIYS